MNVVHATSVHHRYGIIDFRIAAGHISTDINQVFGFAIGRHNFLEFARAVFLFFIYNIFHYPADTAQDINGRIMGMVGQIPR